MPNDRLSKGSRANVVTVVLLLASILTKATAETRFVEVQSGIDFANVSGSPEKKYIIETQAAGVTTWDYDLDGDPDFFDYDGDTDLDMFVLQKAAVVLKIECRQVLDEIASRMVGTLYFSSASNWSRDADHQSQDVHRRWRFPSLDLREGRD